MSHDKASFWVIWLNITVFQRRYYRTRTCTTSVIISVSSGLVDSRIIFQTTYSTNVCQISSNIYIFNKWSRNPAWVLHTDSMHNFILHFRKGYEDHFEWETRDSNPAHTAYGASSRICTYIFLKERVSYSILVKAAALTYWASLPNWMATPWVAQGSSDFQSEALTAYTK